MRMKYLFVEFIIIVSMFVLINHEDLNERNGKKSSDLTNNIKTIVLSENGASRATAYIESNKILSYKEKTFVTFLENGNDNKFEVILAELNKDKIVKRISLGNVDSNHGGGSIRFDNQGRIIIIYGGHLSGLKLRYSMEPYNINQMSDVIDINEKGTALTYPSFIIDKYDNIHLICRKQDMNELSPSRPSLNYYKFDIYNNYNIITNKRLIDFPNYKYGNFTASINLSEDKLSVIYRIYLTENDGSIVSENGYGAIISEDYGESFKTYQNEKIELPINFKATSNIEISSDTLFYISNIEPTKNKYISFILTEMSHGNEMSYLIKLRNGKMEKTELKDIYEDLKEEKINVYVGISSDKLGNSYLVFSSLPNSSEEKWDSKNNRINFFQISNGTANLIYEHNLDNERSWLPSIEQIDFSRNASSYIPKIMYSSGDTSNDLYKKVDSKVILVDFNSYD